MYTYFKITSSMISNMMYVNKYTRVQAIYMLVESYLRNDNKHHKLWNKLNKYIKTYVISQSNS